MPRISEPKTILGIRLTQARKDKKLLQKDAAEHFKISPQVMANYEKGNREPSIITLNELAQYYGVTVDYLTGNSDYACFEVEALSHTLPFSKTVIKSILAVNETLKGYLEEIIVNDNFLNLLDALKKYKYGFENGFRYNGVSDEEQKKVEEIYKRLNIDLLQVTCRKLVDNALADIINEIDNIDKRRSNNVNRKKK